MDRKAFSRLLVGNLMVSSVIVGSVITGSATLGCNATNSLQRPSQHVPDRVTSLSSDPEAEPSDVSFTTGADEPVDSLQEVAILIGVADQTVVTVNDDAVSDAAEVLHFTPARRGRETLGVRVFFADGKEDGDDGTYLGLRRTDRIEEIDGLTIADLGVFLELWQGVGKKPEVRLLLNREGAPHTVVYRRRFAGTARSN